MTLLITTVTNDKKTLSHDQNDDKILTNKKLKSNPTKTHKKSR